MKRIILLSCFSFLSMLVFSQVTFVGISPASIGGQQFDFNWVGPGIDNGQWMSAPDLNIPGNAVRDTLVIVDDGSTGENDQGNPISAEGCNPLINANEVAGKIAVIYRNTCEFGTKAMNAQNAGAVGVIIINREDALVSMAPGAEGGNVTIPTIFISSVTGQLLTNEMNNGPVEVFIGSKFGFLENDVAINRDSTLISPFASSNNRIDNGFDIGTTVSNYGYAGQSTVRVSAEIEGPNGTVYSETYGPFSMDSMSEIYIDQLPPFSMNSYDLGEYTLTYVASMETPDMDTLDNVYSTNFKITEDILSLASSDENGMPVSTGYPINSDGEYRSCMIVRHPNASALGVAGIYFTPYADTTQILLEGETISVSVSEWSTPWTTISDIAYDNLNEIDAVAYSVQSNNESEAVVYVELNDAFAMVDNKPYLFCLTAFSQGVGFGYDQVTNYTGHRNVLNSVISPVLTTDENGASWYGRGWRSYTAPSIGLKIIDPSTISLTENKIAEGILYPNPTSGMVHIQLESKENGTIIVTDLAGKIVLKTQTSFASGDVQLDLNGIEMGSYIVTVGLESGTTAQFNVLKQ